MNSKIVRFISRSSFELGLMLVLFITGLTYENTKSFLANNDWVDQANSELSSLREVADSLDRVHDSFGGYVDHSSKDARAAFESQIRLQQSDVAKLLALDLNPSAHAQVVAYAQHSDKTIELLERAILKRRHAHLLFWGGGKDLADALSDLRQELASLISQERSAIFALQSRSETTANLKLLAVGFAAFVAFMLLTISRGLFSGAQVVVRDFRNSEMTESMDFIESTDETEVASHASVNSMNSLVSALIVDDEASRMLELQNHLKLMGIAATPAINGAEAIEIARNQKFDLIFVNWNMLGINGATTSSVIRKQYATNGLRTSIIAILTEKTDGLQTANADYVIDKRGDDPLEFAKLAALVVQILNPSKASPLAPVASSPSAEI